MRRDISFSSQGTECRGWLYVPDNLAPGTRAPALVTANALTAVKEITLPGYAERFAAAGFVTLVFDYRFWGQSGGEPRNQIIPYEQLQDLRNALTWLSQQPEVDRDRLGGWGISFGGAHMLHLATWDRRLRAVAATAASVNNAPMYEAMMGREGFQGMLAYLGSDRDVRSQSGAPATYKTAWGKFGEDCAFPVEEGAQFYAEAQRTVAPGFENRVSVESQEKILEYNPDSAIDLASPTAVLIVHGERDIIPVALIRQVYERAREPKKFVVFDCLHSDLYTREPWLTQSADTAIDWFNTHLAARPAR